MAPGSAVTGTARFKLLSLASFGLISGACFFIGYYLLRRYRKTPPHKTEVSSEEKLAAKSDDASRADGVLDQPDYKEVANKTSEEKRKEKEEKEALPAKQENTSTQHESTSGILDTTEQGSSKIVHSPNVAHSFLLDSSRATISGADIETKNKHPTETKAENESGRETKEATAAEITDLESRSEPKHLIATRKDVDLYPEEELKSATIKTVQAEKPPSTSERKHIKTAEATADKDSRPETVQYTKTNEATKENEKQSAAIKRVKTKDVNAKKQPKSDTALEVKPAEPTVQKPSSSNRSETKTAIEIDGEKPTRETKKYANTTETSGENEPESVTLNYVKATEEPSEKEKKSETCSGAKIAETSPTEELQSERKDCKSPEIAADRDRKLELPRSTKSHIPEPIKRSADDRLHSGKDSATTRKAETDDPVASQVKDEPKPASYEHPGLKESKHTESRIVKPPPNRDAATSGGFRPRQPQQAQEPPSTDDNKDNQTTEATNFAAVKSDNNADGAASSLNFSPGQNVSATEEHVTESDDTSTLISPSTKSLFPVSALTPPPDTNKQSRRNRDRGTRGHQKAAAESASESVALENQSSETRNRWPTLEDKALHKVEVDTNSQQVLWKTDKTQLDSAQTNPQSPWTSPLAVQDETSSSGGIKKIEFDDNFVNPVSTKIHSPAQGSEGSIPSDVTKQSSLLNTTPECVLERKPLISEDDDDEDVADNDDEGVKKQFVTKNGNKNGNEVKAEPTREPSSSEATIKLVEIHQNCVGSLIGLTGKEVDRDVRLASLRALVNLSWTSEKHLEYTPIIDQLCANIDSEDVSLKLESLRVLVNLSKNPAMVPHLLAAKAPSCLLKLLVPEVSEEILINWLTVLDDILWTSKEMCLTYASLPTEHRAASPETLYTGLYGLKNSRVLKSRIFVLSRHKSQQVTYLASHIYSCLTC